jgi:hypothetical protein
MPEFCTALPEVCQLLVGQLQFTITVIYPQRLSRCVVN